jgi:hypothetical protein
MTVPDGIGLAGIVMVANVLSPRKKVVASAVPLPNAVVIILAVVVPVTLVALVAVVADVADVAVVALPLSEAVIVPALKLPDASRATIVLTVFAEAVVIAWVCDVAVVAFVVLVVSVLGVPIVTEPEPVMVVKFIPLPDATEVTVPLLTAAMDIEPAPFVTVTPVPAVKVVRVNPVPLPISSAPFAGVVVSPVPPLPIGSVPVTAFAWLSATAPKATAVPLRRRT